MTRWEVRVRPDADWGAAIAAVEACGAACGLQVTLRATLRRHPGSTHWHFKAGRGRGVLEVTLWPGGRQLWLSVQAGRSGDWTAQAAERLRGLLERDPRISGP